MSNLLGVCPLKRKNCPYRDSYCSDCIKYETEQKKQKRKGSKEDVFTRKEELSKEESEWLIDFITKEDN